MGIQDRMLEDIKTAMRAKDSDRLSVLRMVKADLMNKKIEKGEALADEEVIRAMQTLVKQRRDSADQFEKGGRLELAAKENAEILVLEGYLPQAAGDDEIEQAVVAAIAETGAASMRDMGNVMKASLEKLSGKTVDGRKVSDLVKARLQ